MYLQISIPNKEMDFQTDTQADMQNNNLKNPDIVEIISPVLQITVPNKRCHFLARGRKLVMSPCDPNWNRSFTTD